MRVLAAALALALSTASAPLAAQDRVEITAEEARQCAIWASFLSSEMGDDPETAQALLFAVNYFVGVYEGKTGRSIAIGDNMAAAEGMTADMEGVSNKCAALMTGYGERMVAWGAVLERLGEQASRR